MHASNRMPRAAAGQSAPRPGGAVEGLPFAERFAIWAVRKWAQGMRSNGLPPRLYWEAFAKLRNQGAGLRLDALLRLLPACAGRPLAIAAPCDCRLSRDEAALLAALAGLQHRPEGPRHLFLRAFAALAPYAGQNALLHWLGREVAESFEVSDLYFAPPAPAAAPQGDKKLYLAFASGGKNQ